MQNGSYQFIDDKVIIRVRNRVCGNSLELLSSEFFDAVLHRYLDELHHQQSRLLDIFADRKVDEDQIKKLKETLVYLTNLPAEKVVKLVEDSAQFLDNPILFNEFVEQMYNYWRRQHRLVICEAIFDRLDQRPYRTFNEMVESLMHLVRSTYRDIQENITGNHPKIYRQVSAGAEIGAIALPKKLEIPKDLSKTLENIFVIRQALLYPPLIFNTPANKRTGVFTRIDHNPLQDIQIDAKEWLCYPAKVGPLLVLVYFSLKMFELGFSLCNLFELADEKDLEHKIDAVLMFGTPKCKSDLKGENEAVFYDDEKNQLLIASIPEGSDFAYFGYLKKMMLTLHNIQRMKNGYLPIHGAMFQITVRGCQPTTMVLVGDTGAGKSETLEALRQIASNEIEDLMIIADDMGSLEINKEGRIICIGTEMGAFVRLDDLQKGYALGQIDRTIIMNPDQVNARVVLPITRFEYVIQGWPINCILYANNYEPVNNENPIIETFDNEGKAMEIFRKGAVMSKGTTSTTGMVENYFANIFGPIQYRDVHEKLAQKFFHSFFEQKIIVGQLRTRLAVAGFERSGPENAAYELLSLIRHLANNSNHRN